MSDRLCKIFCALTHYHTIPTFNDLEREAGNQHFLLFPQCFLPFPKQIFNFSFMYDMSSANAVK